MSAHDVVVPLAKRSWARVVSTLGFRGAALLLFAFAYFGIGFGVLAMPDTPRELFYSQVPAPLRAALWVGCGTFAAVAAVVNRPRWQSPGFVVLFLPTVERLVGYLGAMLADLPAPHVVAIGCLFIIAMLALLLNLFDTRGHRAAGFIGVAALLALAGATRRARRRRRAAVSLAAGGGRLLPVLRAGRAPRRLAGTVPPDTQRQATLMPLPLTLLQILYRLSPESTSGLYILGAAIAAAVGGVVVGKLSSNAQNRQSSGDLAVRIARRSEARAQRAEARLDANDEWRRQLTDEWWPLHDERDRLVETALRAHDDRAEIPPRLPMPAYNRPQLPPEDDDDDKAAA